MSNDSTTVLPDGSAFTVASLPLPKDHWIYQPAGKTPAPFRIGLSDERTRLVEYIREAAKYAIRGATMSGKEQDFDPDAMVQNFIVGMLGCHTPDGKCSE